MEESELDKKYQQQAELISSLFEDELVSIKHVGTGPVIEIDLLVSAEEYLQAYNSSLAKIGYIYFPDNSSPKRLLYRKGEPTEFILYLSQESK